jgi:serine/threonine protein kinase
MSYSIGDTIGAYRVIEELGRGGMGRVFRVEHTITRRQEALKLLEGGRPEVADQAARWLREIQIQSSLDHPNIAGVHNAFWMGEDLVLVMELIEGCTLASLLESGRLPLGTMLNYACQALSALAFAHAHGVIHRDVSSSNLMISRSGVLKLTDFGLSKGPADVRTTLTGEIVGSLNYMSPEQVRCAPVDARSDIYSLGVVLYELTTGKRPFDSGNAYSIMVDQVNKSPVPPIAIEPSLPNLLNDAVLKSLEKDPAMRFQNAEQFRLALIDVQYQGMPPNPRARASISRAWITWAAVILIATVAIASIKPLRWLTSGPRVPEKPDSIAHERVRPVLTPQTPAPAPVSINPPEHHVAKQDQNTKAPVASSTHQTTVRPRRLVQVNIPDSGTPNAADPQRLTTAGNVDTDAIVKHNRLIGGLGKLWHLVRRKKAPTTNEP